MQALYCRVCGQPLRGSFTGTLGSMNAVRRPGQRASLKQRYVILGPAGRGGFGAVYKAVDTQLGNRLVAIKEMSQNNLNAQDTLAATETFKHEALLLASLTHPNLPRIYEQFVDTGRLYLVMDFIEGETLEDRISRSGGKLPVEHALDIGIQLCSVLDYLHTRQPPVIFRDMKPANVMLTPTGHVYLIDFGIARHFKPGQTRDTTALGSSGYAAPEQYGKAQTTARADIYGLGATLHQLITGDDPSESPFHFAPPQLRNQPALAGLDTLLMSMVSVDSNKRPESAAIVRQELQRIALQYATAATQPLQYSVPNAYQAPPAAPRTAKIKQVTPPQVRPQLNTLYVCYGHLSRITALAWSPDGRRLASASYDRTIQVWDATNGKNLLTYRGHFDRVHSIAWSPDSRYVVSTCQDGGVHIWDATTKDLVYSYRGHRGSVNAVAWSPNGFYIATAGNDKTVQVWHASNHMLLYTYYGHSQKVRALAWSPDGTRIASAGDDSKVQIWEPLKDQQKRSFFLSFTSKLSAHRGQLTLSGHRGRVNALAWSFDGKRVAAASSDQRVMAWDVQMGNVVFTQGISGSGMKNAVSWSPISRHLAIGGNDKIVEVWNTTSKSLTLPYYGHTGYVMAVAWSPDGSRIASAGVDRTVQVWQAI